MAGKEDKPITYIIIALSILAGRYVDMPVWQLVIIGLATMWEIRQLRGGEKVKKTEFEKTYAKLEDRVKELRDECNFNDDAIRCYLIGWVSKGGGCYTSSQLRQIFDMGFSDGRR